MVSVYNETRNLLLAKQCLVARGFLQRMRGLIGRSAMAPGEALLIEPCSSVHSFFMRFPIDILFADRHDRVVGLRADLPPNRPFAGARRARYVIELPTGMIAATGTQLGDQLRLELL
jgi:uncharacterized membrane protein (UPF0127 family)